MLVLREGRSRGKFNAIHQFSQRQDAEWGVGMHKASIINRPGAYGIFYDRAGFQLCAPSKTHTQAFASFLPFLPSFL